MGLETMGLDHRRIDLSGRYLAISLLTDCLEEKSFSSRLGGVR